MMLKPNIIALAESLAIEFDSNPFKLIRDHKIKLVYDEFDEFSGGCIRVHGKDLIILNNELSELESYYVAAHEVGHLLIHKNEDRLVQLFSLNESKIEAQANIFACIFLKYFEMDYVDERDTKIVQLITNTKSGHGL